MSTIDQFKANLRNGGVRPNQFRVIIPIPGAVTESARLEFLCHAASLPGSTIGTVEVGFRGRVLKLAGERTFDNWSIDVYNDDFGLHKAFMNWSNAINNIKDNTSKGVAARQSGVFGSTSYYEATMHVIQLDRNNNPMKTYKFNGAWPTTIGEIKLGFGENTSIETFNVSMTYLNFEEVTSVGSISV